MAVEHEVMRVDKLAKEDAHRMILTHNSPIVFENMIQEWPSRHWTASQLCKMHPKKVTKFRVCKMATNRPEGCDDSPIMETDCKYTNATLNDFSMWLEGKACPGNALKEYSRLENSCYADYKYMHEIFQNEPEMLEAIDWGAFGFTGRGGSESTIWIGSTGAFTPCHQDSYGFNLVAQLSGKKRWTLFSPEDSDKLYPTRIPYEESSIFSSVNLKNPNYSKHPGFKDAKKYKVVLNAGDVLYLPKHWWHFVENLESSVSVNTWIEKDSDKEDRVNEAITRTLVCSLKGSEGTSHPSWLNPNEEIYPHETNMKYLQMAVAKLLMTKKSPDSEEFEVEATENTLNTDCLINCLASKNVLNALKAELKSKFK